MQGYAPRPTSVPAISRTWEARVIYRECGVITEIATHTVTISRETGEYTAEIDGQLAPIYTAARILSSAKADRGLTLKHEVRPVPLTMLTCLGLNV